MGSCQILWKSLRENRWVACGLYVCNTARNLPIFISRVFLYVENRIVVRKSTAPSGKKWLGLWEKFIDWLTSKIRVFHVFHIAYNYYYLFI